MRIKITILGLFCWAACAVSYAKEPLGLTLGPGGTVLKEGQPYRGVGLNYLDCFTRTLRKNTDTSYEEGFRVLAEHHIPFVRCAFTPLSVKEMQLYQENREAYFKLMDWVVQCAERSGVGLIPSIFFAAKTMVPRLVKEHADQWGNPGSQTMAFMRQYTHEVVSRYRNSPAIWAWEFCNEYNSYADLPYAATYLPKVKDSGATEPKFPTPRDYPTHDIMIVAFREFARAVRRDDPNRLIESGADFPRKSAWHFYKEHNSTIDTPAQFEVMLSLNAIDPMDLISVHCYNDTPTKLQRKDNWERLDAAVAAARNLGKPLFVGEFQYPSEYGPDSPQARRAMDEFLAKLDRLQVPLAAVWVFDFANQEKDRNITATNQRAWELPLIRAHNEKLARSSNR
ncbi:MAG: cellulase family glycosylhydrolase [Methylococcaceae bacterium]|nr:cellulase family glycosylhydrolase [Methylococcaceae bacterium]